MLNRDNGERTVQVRDNSYAGRLKRLEAKVAELQDVVEQLQEAIQWPAMLNARKERKK